MATIFVVDDNQDFQTFMRGCLEGWEHKVVTVLDPVQLGVLLRDTIPDLIILDYHMPGGGAQLAEKVIKERPATCKIPILFQTGTNLEKMKELASSWTVPHRIIQKPVKVELLKQYLNELLPQPS